MRHLSAIKLTTLFILVSCWSTLEADNVNSMASTNALTFAIQAGSVAGAAQGCGQDITTFVGRVNEALDKLSISPTDKVLAMSSFQKSLQQAQTTQTNIHAIPCQQVVQDFNNLPLMRSDYQQTVISQLSPSMGAVNPPGTPGAAPNPPGGYPPPQQQQPQYGVQPQTQQMPQQPPYGTPSQTQQMPQQPQYGAPQTQQPQQMPPQPSYGMPNQQPQMPQPSAPQTNPNYPQINPNNPMGQPVMPQQQPTMPQQPVNPSLPQPLNSGPSADNSSYGPTSQNPGAPNPYLPPQSSTTAMANNTSTTQSYQSAN